jgi:hypothetical protein
VALPLCASSGRAMIGTLMLRSAEFLIGRSTKRHFPRKGCDADHKKSTALAQGPGMCAAEGDLDLRAKPRRRFCLFLGV